MSSEYVDTMNVHVFGFPAALQEKKIGHAYAIIPAQITGWSKTEMMLSFLSAPGLSGGPVVCSKRGVAVGYIGGGFDGSTMNEQYESYAFSFYGLPSRFQSRLLPIPKDETKKVDQV
ncbi:hypothetical protein CCR75_008144 [Bremia lactucae]|uniref:Serine protease n=1 Tax=Bremia lactucae TaxID=4779 RepID=A0A976FF98_BRELC|nr:hypothetical protein CCR75_008144 [Bremia lactucae]